MAAKSSRACISSCHDIYNWSHFKSWIVPNLSVFPPLFTSAALLSVSLALLASGVLRRLYAFKVYLPRCRFGFTAITSHPSKPELSKNAALPSVSQAPSLSSDHNYLPRKAFRCSTCLWPQECSNLQDKYKKVICDPAAVLRHQDDCCFHLLF